MTRRVRAYQAYRALSANSKAITSFVHCVTWHWKRALGAGQPKGRVACESMAPTAALWLPSDNVQRPHHCGGRRTGRSASLSHRLHYAPRAPCLLHHQLGRDL